MRQSGAIYFSRNNYFRQSGAIFFSWNDRGRQSGAGRYYDWKKLIDNCELIIVNGICALRACLNACGEKIEETK
jgi:hypothetical protein